MDTVAWQSQRIYPALRYDDAKAAIEWLVSVLGFEQHVVYAGEGDTVAHAQLNLGGSLIMLGSVKDGAYGRSPKALGDVTGTVYIALDTAAEVDALHARAKASAAEIMREPCDTEYGSREFSVRDPEGQIWSFGTYRPSASTPH